MLCKCYQSYSCCLDNNLPNVDATICELVASRPIMVLVVLVINNADSLSSELSDLVNIYYHLLPIPEKPTHAHIYIDTFYHTLNFPVNFP